MLYHARQPRLPFPMCLVKAHSVSQHSTQPLHLLHKKPSSSHSVKLFLVRTAKLLPPPTCTQQWSAAAECCKLHRSAAQAELFSIRSGTKSEYMVTCKKSKSASTPFTCSHGRGQVKPTFSQA